ncbi:hypothetical protein CLG_B2294 [Clostridium phage D-1873]|uniref:Terminase n=1 Tax=Clostridium botulinum D str. 1873 TaxID=592027 RepID=A0A9P2G5H0_CLOBO|nr:hypothetical protein [Clostridium botulinum]EES90358.1 hypothetical protein CLG_B2294 [Clostridium phage D-1873]QPW56460.1 hypothetical protein IRP61_11320 [Clostridium botulinum]
MGSFKNFKNENNNVTKNRYDRYNPSFTSFKKKDNKKAQEKIKKFEDNKKNFIMWASFFRAYPDIFIDMVTPQDSYFKLYPYQRIMLRLLFRYQYCFGTLTRGSAKSFVEVLACLLKDIMYAGLKNSITASGSKQQGRDIANEKIDEIERFLPVIAKEIKNKSVGKDYVEVEMYNKSWLGVVGCHNNSRGGRKNQGCIEEAFDVDVQTLNEAILPMFNVKRRTPRGIEDENEFDEQLWYVTTAGFYDTAICRKQVDMLHQMSKQSSYSGKNTYCVFGSSYELPLYHGLLKQSKVDAITNDSSYSQLSFDREYRSIWIKFSDKAFFKLDDINNCRVIKHCELEADFKNHKDDFYIISYDVARQGGTANDASIATIFRCTPRTDGSYFKNVVAMYSCEDKNKNNNNVNSIMHFKNQCIMLKRLVEKYQAKALLVDINGIGSGLLDYLTDTTEDEEYGKTYQPYGLVSVNADENKGSVIQGSLPILHGMKTTTAEINNDIHNTFLGHIQTKSIRFLTTPMEAEQEIKGKSKKISQDTKIMMLQNYYQTDALIQEMMQLEVEMKGHNIALKPITSSRRKDRFSSVEYGVWWITRYLEPKNKTDDEYDDDDPLVYYI